MGSRRNVSVETDSVTPPSNHSLATCIPPAGTTRGSSPGRDGRKRMVANEWPHRCMHGDFDHSADWRATNRETLCGICIGQFLSQSCSRRGLYKQPDDIGQCKLSGFADALNLFCASVANSPSSRQSGSFLSLASKIRIAIMFSNGGWLARIRSVSIRNRFRIK